MKQQEIVKQLYEAFDSFNHELFTDSLPAIVITLHRAKNAHGYFGSNHYRAATENAPKKYTHELAINPDSLSRTGDAKTDTQLVLSTLAHEMCHLWQTTHGRPSRAAYHDQQWAQKMLQIGLKPENAQDKNKMTGQSCTHSIIPNGPFAAATAKLMSDGFIFAYVTNRTAAEEAKAKAKTKIKYTCPSCQINAWGKPGLNLGCALILIPDTP